MRVTVALHSAFQTATEVATPLFVCYMAAPASNACLGTVHFFILGLEYISKQEGFTPLFVCYMAAAASNACLGTVHFFILGLEDIYKQEG